MFGIVRSIRRHFWAKRPLPQVWLDIVEKKVPFYDELTAPQKQRFLSLLKVFIWEKHFEGAAGMEVTDEVKVVIAACAVRLILALDLSYYDRLSEIVVYPSAYQHADRDGAILGEANSWGTVVLSWRAVLSGLHNPSDGHDTAAHEFAHVLDRADGAFDGTPELDEYKAYSPWASVMSEHYLALRKGKRPQRRVLREYGATNEAEFFAVATESFFEKPRQMKKRTPKLYAELKKFYRSDPATVVAEDNDEPGRNDPCPCGSGKKYKKCCGR